MYFPPLVSYFLVILCNIYMCYFNYRIENNIIFHIVLPPENLFTLTCLRVRMSHHRFNNFVELLNGDLAAKIGRGIFSKDLMDRKCNCSLISKVNVKCVYEGK